MEPRKINYPDGFNGSPLHSMFDLQKGLIQQYAKIEKMPLYPINISEREGQALMKEFIRRGMQELSEAHEIYLSMFKVCNNQSDNGADLRDAVLDFNEELSDALHFFIEALLYCNVGADDVASYYERFARDMDLSFNSKNPLQAMVMIARFDLSKQNYDMGTSGFVTVDPSKEEAFFKSCAGRRVSKSLLYAQSELIWDVCHNFFKATNLLKNNPWKQTEEETDAHQFQYQMMLGWIALMNLLVFSGYDAEGILLSYCHKHSINLQRIKEKR